MTVRAPFDGTILRFEARAGQYAASGDSNPDTCTLLIGDCDPLHLRVEFDQYEIPDFDTAGKAVAFARSKGEEPIELEYDHTELYVIPKQALTSSQTQVTDIRSMVVIYKIKKSNVPLMVGQQLNVYVERK